MMSVNLFRKDPSMTSPIVALAGILSFVCQPVLAGKIESAYTFGFLEACIWNPEEQTEMGGEAICPGYNGYSIHLNAYDLKYLVDFGPVDEPWEFRGGFQGFNYTNSTVEWRLEGGKPYATILRWYVDTFDERVADIGEGQILVISTVADPDKPEGQRKSCPVGYVDALANSDANTIAQQVADTIGRDFVCGDDRVQIYGKTGPLSVDLRED